MIQKLILFACLLSLSFSTTSRAQWIQTNGPNAGDIHALVASGTTSSPMLFAATGGGVSRTTDNGALWSAANTGLTNLGVYALIMKVSTDGLDTNLFAGTYGSGVFRSTDLGTSWTQAGLPSSVVYAFTVSGTNLFTGTSAGLFRSSDNGANWTPAGSPLASATIWSFVVKVSPDGRDTDLFVGTYQKGIFRSSDNGVNWTAVSSGLTDSSIFSLAIIGANSASPTLFAGTYRNGVFRSTDNGASWADASSGLSDLSVYSLAVSGANSTSPILFAGTHDSVYRSNDNGTNWTAVSIGLTEPSVYALAMSDEDLFAAAGYGRVWRRALSELNGSNAVAQIAQPNQNAAEAYPNPFPESASVLVTMAARGPAQVTIVNLLGEPVARLFDGELDAGEHSFEWNASGAAAGTYFVRIRTGSAEQLVSLRRE